MGKHRGELRSAFGEEKTLSEWKADPRCVVSSSGVDRRLRRGLTLEQALTLLPNEEDLREAFGERKTLGQWVKDSRCAVPERTLIDRIARGEPLEEALTRPAHKFASIRERKGKKWTAFGESLTVNQWVEDPRCVVPSNVLRMRLESGVEPETAITKPVRNHEREFEAFGDKKSLTAWSKDERCVVSYKILTQRLDRGWDIVDALSVPPRSMGNPQSNRKKKRTPSSRELPDGREVLVEAFGEKKTLREWASDPRCQVPYLRLRTRLRKNWSLEDAITTIPAVGHRNVEAFGESKSLHAWAKDPRCLVSAKALRYRMDNGESLEDAMSRPPQNEGRRPIRKRRRRNRRRRNTTA
jgi:hypothetical protein